MRDFLVARTLLRTTEHIKPRTHARSEIRTRDHKNQTVKTAKTFVTDGTVTGTGINTTYTGF
jgi:ABC-type uncharacterized transport system auxiliary subunit